MFLLVQSTHRMVVRFDPVIGHRFVPGLVARIPSERGGYLMRTNAQGFRSDVDFRRARGERPRILFFGDSMTAGDGCANEERFSERVGELLDAEVYNYGLSGSGTDQQLLIYEQLARDVEADLLVFCVQPENMDRIQVAFRPSIDRVSRRRILVPKPYFTLEGGELVLHHSPVPRERPGEEEVDESRRDADETRHGGLTAALMDFYRNAPRLDALRELSRRRLEPLRGAVLRATSFDPYPDYARPESDGWALMRAILSRFLDGADGRPILIAPVPNHYYFTYKLAPVFQQRLEELEDRARGVHVADLVRPLQKLGRAERARLRLGRDTHFSPWGHDRVAERIAAAIRERGLLPARAREGPALLRAPARRRRPEGRHVLGISSMYHNSAAALVSEGRIAAAAEEERFTRVKNDRRFPVNAINFCLEQARVEPEDLAAVVYYDNAYLTFERILHALAAGGEEARDAWLRILPTWLQYKLRIPQLIREELRYDGPVLQETHHRSHAASAFLPSPFPRAAILSVDGVGEWATASIGRGEGSRIELLEEMRFPHSLGLLYSAFTQFTGFKVNSGEYKMMGLAPYGKPRYVRAILEHLVDLKPDGSLELDMERFAFLTEPRMTNERFAELFDGPARAPESRITRREMDIARSIQEVTEEALLRMARHAHALTGEERLCLSGGVALNCVANGRILREGPFEDLWIQPAAGDSGSALGAALDVYYDHLDGKRELPEGGRSLQGGSCLGPAFAREEIRAFLETHGYPHEETGSGEERAQRIAELLERGRVVGHFCDRLEFGPRALGARSILGDARNPETQVNLNLQIKYRESFRPFAPSVLAERCKDYFELDGESPYMLIVAPVRGDRRLPLADGSGEDLLEIVRQPRSDVPAVTHVDYSARIQTVRREDHPAYYDVIRAFAERTGVGVIVNTSFNVRGEPIVCTPHDAYRCFMRTEMDVLALGDFLLFKDAQPPWPEPRGHVEEEREAPAPPADRALLDALHRVFERDFLPVARELERAGRIGVLGRGAASRWTPCAPPSAANGSRFAIDPVLLADDAPAAALAEALVRQWEDRAAGEALRPVVAKLLALGRRHPAASAHEEEVSDSVYVMF